MEIEQQNKLDLEVVKAIITIVKLCAVQDSCAECPMRALCGKQPLEW